MRSIDQGKLVAIQGNIHPPAHRTIGDWGTFNWHRSRTGDIDTDLPHSSQAFCISVWGSLPLSSSSGGYERVRKAASLSEGWEFLDSPGAVIFEFADASLLNERGTPQATSVDALLQFDGHVVVVESKLTEALGSCSQAANKACTGRYEIGSDLKTGTNAPCRLTIRDGRRTPRRYWEMMGRVSREVRSTQGVRCPFLDESYQVMRNIATAIALAERLGKEWRVLFAFPGSSDHDTLHHVDRVTDLLDEWYRSRVAVVDYEVLNAVLGESDDPAALSLSRYMSSRLDLVGKVIRPSSEQPPVESAADGQRER